MGFQISRAFRTGLGQVASIPGLIFAGLFALWSVGSDVLWDSVADLLRDQPAVQQLLRDVREAVPEATDEQVTAQLDGETVLAVLEWPIDVLVGVLVAVWLGRLLVRIGAIRWFVADGERFGVGLFARRPVRTVANLVLAQLAFVAVVLAVPIAILVAVAQTADPAATLAVGVILLFVVLYLFFALVLFDFEVAVRDANGLAALSRSWNLTSGARLELFLLLLLAGIATAILEVPVGLATSGDLQVAGATEAAFDGIVTVVDLGILSAAYDQLRDKV